MLWLCLATLAAVAGTARAHGRVLLPPSRASAWRLGFDTAPNYDDDGLNCGGFAMQWSVNGGRCGICGDPYQVPPPRPHELGGYYGQGVIVGKYLTGSLLTTTVDLTTSHLGFWEFKLCPDPENNEQKCFDRHILELENGGTKYYPKEGSKKYTVTYRLPKGMVCDHCVLQWRYTAGNNWGDCRNGTQALGCGNQEQFGACSDISIGVTKSLPLALKEHGTKYNEIPYPLFYYLKHGYFDNEQGNRETPAIPQQQLLANHDRKKPQTHKKKPNPHLKPSLNQQPSNTHQNHIIIQQLKQPQFQKKPPSQNKQTYTIQFGKHTQPSEKYEQPYSQKYTLQFDKHVQPIEDEEYELPYSPEYMLEFNKHEQTNKKNELGHSQKYTLHFDKNVQPTEEYEQPHSHKYTLQFDKNAQPTKEYEQPYSQKYTLHFDRHAQSAEQNEKPHSQKHKESSEVNVWQWQPNDFFDNHFQSHLQPVFFEYEPRKKPGHLELTHRKPRLKHKRSKNKSKWPKLFYGIWR